MKNDLFDRWEKWNWGPDPAAQKRRLADAKAEWARVRQKKWAAFRGIFPRCGSIHWPVLSIRRAWFILAVATLLGAAHCFRYQPVGYPLCWDRLQQHLSQCP